MKLGIRGKLFALALGIITIALAALNAFVSSELRAQIEARMTADLVVRAELVGQKLEALPSGSDWQAVAEDLAQKAQVRATLVSADGKVLGDSGATRAELPKLENLADEREISAALKAANGDTAHASSGFRHDLLMVAVPVASGTVRAARLSQSLAPIEAAIAHAQYMMLWGALFAIAAAGLLASAGAHAVSRAILSLRGTAIAMLSDLSVRSRMRGDDDIGSLGEALDGLAENLHRTVRSLGSERDRLAGILETMAEGVLLTDPRGRVILANASLRIMVGASGQLIGKQPIEAIRNDELAEMISSVTETQKPTTGEVDLLGIVPRRVLVRAAPLAARGNHGVVAVLSDVTDLRRLESLRRDFVANVSHELRTPIAAIRAASETLEGGAIDDPVAAKDFIGMISRHGERLHQLVEDLLELSRIEAHKLDLKPSTIDVTELIEHMLSLYSLSANRREVALVASGARGLSLIADRRALEQILSNLIDNAIKYAQPGASVTLAASERNDEILIAIRDTGPGIAAKHLPRLFERFYRVDRGRSREVGGTGLGLSIVKHLTEALGGHVMVESIPGVGSTFTVHFPAKLVGNAPQASIESRTDNAGLSH